MSLNYKEIDLILQESRLEGSLINAVVQPNFDDLYLLVYRGADALALRICLGERRTRIHFDKTPPKKKGRAPRFAEFLEKRIQGARIQSIEQIGRERIIRICIEGVDQETYLLWIRLWSNAANVFLCDTENTILDCFFRRPKKNEVTGGSFVLPAEAPREKSYEVRALPDGFDGSFSEHIATFYRNLEINLERTRLCERIRASLSSLHADLGSKRAGLSARLARQGEDERMQHFGDVIQAYAHEIHKGQEWAEVLDWETSQTVRLELDAKKTPHENAERYYAKARKARESLQYVNDDLVRVNNSLAHLAEIGARFVPDGDIRELHTIAAELDAMSERRASPDDSQDSIPGTSFLSGTVNILVGRDASENDVLLRKYVRGNDWWLHARDYAGGYIFIKMPRGKSPSLDVLLDAAHLAVWYSKARGQTDVDLYYTQVKYLRRAKHGTLGTVLPMQEKNFRVRIEEARMERLLGT